MRVDLFVPCFVDQFAPDVGFATVELLERLGCEVRFRKEQTCCGQPLANSGFTDEACSLAKRFLDVFDGADYIVAPSGSCVAMVRKQFPHLVEDDPRMAACAERTFELCEFLVDVLKVGRIPSRFPHRVALHKSCHGLRELRLGRSSERMEPDFDKVAAVLERVEGLELVPLERADECCGFGGTFSVKESDVACAMGRDKLVSAENSGAEVLASTDSSCLLHLGGVFDREGARIRRMHVAEILAGRPLPA